MSALTLRFFPEKAVRAGQFVVLGEALVRGISYIVTPPATVVTMTAAEQTLPMTVWGIVFVALAVLGAGFQLWWIFRRPKFRNPLENWIHPVARVAHVILGILMIALSLSSLAGILDRTPLYGFYTPYDTAVLAYAHWVFTLRGNRAVVVDDERSR